MKVYQSKKNNELTVINQSLKILRQGGLVVYPTETCYGAGVDATNQKAVKKLLLFKGKRSGKAISIGVTDIKMANQYVNINETGKNLYQIFLPGPLTIISKSKGKAVRALEGAGQSLGVRIPDYPLVLKIIKNFGRSITATSANPAGKKPPYSLKDFLKYVSPSKQKFVDLFIDAGKLPHRLPSSVVDTTLNEPKILRQGEILIPKTKAKTFISNSPLQTMEIAQKILKHYFNLLKSKVLIFALQGELGAGKTQFVKGLAKSLKIKTNLPSPTYILLREYDFQLNNFLSSLYHLDTWRMQSESDLLALGFTKMLKAGNVIAIEWLQKVKSFLEKIEKENKNIKVIWINMEYIAQKKRRIAYK